MVIPNIFLLLFQQVIRLKQKTTKSTWVKEPKDAKSRRNRLFAVYYQDVGGGDRFIKKPDKILIVVAKDNYFAKK